MTLELILDSATVFPTQLGWVSVAFRDEKLRHVSFGHTSKQLAKDRLGTRPLPASQLTSQQQDVIERIKSFAKGGEEEFGDIALDLGKTTRFQERVYRHCRKIPRGETRSYKDLATRAGSPNAARAVGNIMASNPIPLIVPCHRVVASGRAGLGGFSAPGGLNMKRRLLALESSSG